MKLRLKDFTKSHWLLFFNVLGILISCWLIRKSIVLGVDPYHEGALFPSAVGFSHGLALFRDVNNQYGFMYAVIQSPFVYLFGNHLLVARLVGAIFYLVNLIITFKIIRFRWGRGIGFLSVLILSAINPSWSYLSSSSMGGYSIWINQYGVTFVLLSLLMLITPRPQLGSSQNLFFFASFISFCAVFVRLEFAAVWVFQLLFLFLSAQAKKGRDSSSIAWIGGGLLALGFGVLFLTFTGGISEAFKQLILVWFSSPPNGAHLGLGNILTFLSSCALFIYMVCISKLMLRLNYWFVWTPIFFIGNFFIFRFALTYLSGLELLGKKLGPYLVTSFDSVFLSYSSFLFVLILLIFISKIRGRNLFNNFESGLLLFSSLGLSAQLHNVNAAYIFMFNPILLATVLFFLHAEKVSSWIFKFVKPIIITLSVFSFISLANGIVLSTHITHKYRAPVLSGMASTDLTVRDEIDQKFELLEKSVRGSNLFIDCPYGLYSVSDKQLITADRWTWNEIPEEWRTASISKAKPGQYLLHCGGGENQKVQYLKWQRLGIIKSIGELPDFHLYRFIKQIPSTSF